MRRWAVAIFLGLFLSWSPDAHARALPTPLATAMQQTAQAIAVQHWGTAPAEDPPIVWAHLGRTINARATWFALGAPLDWTQYTDEKITFSYDVGWNWPKFCTVMVHEYGHLLGKVHTDDPRDVMTAVYAGPIRECVPRQVRPRVMRRFP